MIKPLQAIAGRTMVTSPFANGAKNAARMYQSATQSATKGDKLNVDCNEVRSVTRCGQKLDLYA